MIFRTSTGKVVNIERASFKSDKEYYNYIKQTVSGIIPFSPNQCIDNLTLLIKKKPSK